MAKIIATDLAARLGKVDCKGKWLPADLPAVDAALKPLTTQRPTDEDGQYIFTGDAPGWLAVAVVHSLNRQGVALQGDGQLAPVSIPKLMPFGSGSEHLTWNVNADAEGFTLVEFSIPGTLDITSLKVSVRSLAEF